MAKNQGNTRRANTDGGTQAATADAARGDTPARRAAAPRAKEPKQYRALARGYVDGRIVEQGEVFATAETKGSWMEEIGAKKRSRLEEAVDDTMATKKDDPDLTTFSLEALQAEALRLGLTDANGLSK